MINLVSVNQLLWVWISVLFQVLHQPHFLQMFQVRNQWCHFCNWWIFGWLFKKLFYKRVPICAQYCLSRRNQKAPSSRHLHSHQKIKQKTNQFPITQVKTIIIIAASFKSNYSSNYSPTRAPSVVPSTSAYQEPSTVSLLKPITSPTTDPSQSPRNNPSKFPSAIPSVDPSKYPSSISSYVPSVNPSGTPS